MRRLLAIFALVVALAPDASAQVAQTWLRVALSPPRPGMRKDPSQAVYPPQSISLRFSHRQHMEAGVECASCHDMIDASARAADRNIPAHVQCETCHDIEAARRGEETDPVSTCVTCHPGYVEARPEATLAKSVFPANNVIFSHQQHLQKGAKCADCHAGVEGQELAVRENLPRMVTCLGCHDGQQAPNRCTTCHLSEPDGLLRTRFASGILVPSGTLRDDDHGRDFLQRHAHVARREMESCSDCHRSAECETCHAGTSKAFRMHPPDWLQSHPVAVRGQQMDCTSCHREQGFCTTCHLQLGVAQDSRLRGIPALGNTPFHPPGFAASSRTSPNHHSFEAQMNMQSCVSCHSEQDCMKCHAVTSATFPGGVNPHPAGWADSGAACRSFKAAPVACAKCHGGGAGLQPGTNTSIGQLLVRCR